MNFDDLLVEVRTSALERVGVILKGDLQLDAEIPFNAVGSWTITIAKDHPLADVLAGPGGGIVVTDLSTGEVLFSGPNVQPEESRSTDNLSGVLTVQGVTDEHVLDDMLAWPDPINGDITTQAVEQDERTGTAEYVIHGYVAANVGPFAPAGRRNNRLIMGEQLGLGEVIDSTARFDKLLTLAQNHALPFGIGFRVRQSGSNLVFETYMPRDQRRLVRLSLENDGLSTSRLASAAPTVTRAIVAGKGGVTTRLFREVSDEHSLAAETDWGRRIEQFVDQQDTRNTDVMILAGKELLKDGGFTSTNARFEPTETFRGTYGKDWALGDTVTIESGQRTYTAPVTAVIYKVSADDGFRIGAILGDPSTFSEYASLSTRLDKVTAVTQAAAVVPVVPVDEITDSLSEALAANDAALADNTAALADLQVALDANDAAMAALDAALDANDAAIAAIGTTANGKNSVKYMTYAPTTEANVAGDIWYVRNATTHRVTAQYEGLGGTSWQSVTLTNIIVTSMDAGAITSGSIDASVIAVLNLNASNITAGSISAARLSATALNASNITSGSINASVIAVTNINASNITVGTLHADRIDLNTLNGKTINGLNITGGVLRTSDVGTARVEISTSTNFGLVSFKNAGNITVGGLQMNSTGELTVTGGSAFFVIGTPTTHLYGATDFVTHGNVISTGTLQSSAGITADGTITLTNIAGTGGSSFVMVGNAGVLSRGASSSLRHKENVEPLALTSEQVLSLDPIQWQYKDREFHGNRHYAGFPAEMAHDLGLTLFVDYDDEGRPDQFRYWEFVAAQQIVLRDLAARLEALEAA